MLNSSGSRHGEVVTPEWTPELSTELMRRMKEAGQKRRSFVVTLGAFASEHDLPLDEVQQKFAVLRSEAGKHEKRINEYHRRAKAYGKKDVHVPNQNYGRPWKDWELDCLEFVRSQNPDLQDGKLAKEIREFLFYRDVKVIYAKLYDLRKKADKKPTAIVSENLGVPNQEDEVPVINKTLPDERYAIGTILKGCMVYQIVSFGFYVRLPNKTCGLVHISEVADAYVNNMNEYVSFGDEVDVQVMAYDQKGRVQLSCKKVKPLQAKPLTTKPRIIEPKHKHDSLVPIGPLPDKPLTPVATPAASEQPETPMVMALAALDETISGLQKLREAIRAMKPIETPKVG